MSMIRSIVVLTIPKAERAKPRRIPIGSGDGAGAEVVGSGSEASASSGSDTGQR